MSATVSSQNVGPQTSVKSPPKWAERQISFIRQKQRSKVQIDINNKNYVQSRGGRPPRAKSTNAKPSKPQVCSTSVTSHAPVLQASASDTVLTERLSRLSMRSGSATSNSSSSSVQRARANRSRNSSAFCRSLDDMVRFIQDSRAKNIVVMCGAGISTSSGIPDFRSPKTGLYANLKQYKIPYPESIFDLDYFEGNPKPFYTLAKELYPTGKYRPNYVHYFLRLLHEKGLLLRVYTQNIDGLERMAGLPQQKLVEAHGTFYTSSCIKCRESYQSELIRKIFFSDKLPRCHKNRCLGLIKPDIVFFGEDLPRRFYYYLRDFPQADMLLVMGTSLEVEPFAGIVDSVRLTIPRILFNRHAVGPFKRKRRMNDVVVKGDIVDQMRRATELLGWGEELQDLMTQNEENARVETVELLGDDKAGLAEAGLLAHPSSHPAATTQTRDVTTTHAQSAKTNPTSNQPAKYTTGVHKQSIKQKTSSAGPNLGGSVQRTSTNSAQKPKNSSTTNKNGYKKPLLVNNLGSLLPNIKKPLAPPRAFHAQASLSRTAGAGNANRFNFLAKNNNDDSDSSEESDSEESSDDE